MRRRVFWKLIVFTTGIALLGGLYISRFSWLEWAGVRLIAHTPPPPPPWDAIIVLSGRPFERSLKAAELYYLHSAPLIALGGAYNDDLLAVGFHPSQECAFTSYALRQLCVPDSAIRPICAATSTYEEILQIRALCAAHQWKRIVIVSSALHGRRIERLAKRWLSQDGIIWGIAAAQPLLYHPTHWWISEAGILAVFEEYVKLLYYGWRGYF